MDLDDSDLPGYATIGDPDGFPAPARRFLKARGSTNAQRWIYLALFNPRNRLTAVRKIVLKGSERAGLVIFSSTRWRDIRSWLDRKRQPTGQPVRGPKS